MKTMNKVRKIKNWIARQIDAQNIANASLTKSKTIHELTQAITRLREEKQFIANDFNISGVMLPQILAHYSAIPHLIAEINRLGGNFPKWDKDRMDTERHKKTPLEPSRRF